MTAFTCAGAGAGACARPPAVRVAACGEQAALSPAMPPLALPQVGGAGGTGGTGGSPEGTPPELAVATAGSARAAAHTAMTIPTRAFTRSVSGRGAGD